MARCRTIKFRRKGCVRLCKTAKGWRFKGACKAGAKAKKSPKRRSPRKGKRRSSKK